MQCPECQSESSGAYCPECGAPLSDARCGACEAALPPGARYCTQCGEAIRPPTPKLPWFVAGAAVVALLLVLFVPAFRPGPDAQADAPTRVAAPAAAASGAGADAPRPPPLTGTPREQADRLFNRIMRARAAGDSLEAARFLPMGIMAYRRVGALDADGLYHLSLLQTMAGRTAAARETAERVLAGAPDHLLALAAAARAARAAGDAEAAGRYYTHLLEVYEAESAKRRTAYVEHARILPEYRDEAERFLGR